MWEKGKNGKKKNMKKQKLKPVKITKNTESRNMKKPESISKRWEKKDRTNVLYHHSDSGK